MKKMGVMICIVIILLSFILNANDLNIIETMISSNRVTEIPDIAKNLSARGSIHQSRGEYKEAVELYEISLMLRERMGLEKSYGYATVLFLLAIAKDRLGDSCNALSHAKKSISVYYYLGKDEDASVLENEIQIYNTNCNLKNKLITLQ
jgi:hypothetical protein